jgi:hypothetical protein
MTFQAFIYVETFLFDVSEEHVLFVGNWIWFRWIPNCLGRSVLFKTRYTGYRPITAKENFRRVSACSEKAKRKKSDHTTTCKKPIRWRFVTTPPCNTNIYACKTNYFMSQFIFGFRRIDWAGGIWGTSTSPLLQMNKQGKGFF